MEADIEADVLFNEIKALKLFSIPHSSNPLDTLQYIFEHILTSSLPNVTISLRILLTLPVSVSSGERSLSKLKIKNFLLLQSP
ncbi:hAT family C-terminal dimerization region [Popillia japonica]|uniref:HAT family C-terminal dimerization region n=1 Tax=Popillia japonica TaxID=7064 RepID=A0AAW1IZF4_POPJA